MPSTDLQSRREQHQRTAVRTALFYSIFAGLWIYFSDTILAWFISDPIQLTQAQTIKGWLFVGVTAALLYCYLAHCLKKLRSNEEALEEERDKSQEGMQDHIHQLNTLFDSMNAVIYVADLETYELLYVNRFAVDFFGPDWQKRKCYDYLQINMDQPCEFCTNPQLLDNGVPGDPVVWEFLNTKNNRWYECFDKAIRWTDGRLVRLEVAQDVTERKELARIKDELLSAMSHEMRTPLTAISGFAELLQEEQDLSEQNRHHINIICQETEKLTELINSFLDIRRLKTDRTRIDYEYLSVRELLEKARANTRDCKKHHVTQVDCQTEAAIYGNRKELNQVLSQLLENACRYSPQGGKINLTAQSNEREVSICVTDQGIGIPEHELKSIFSPFHRLDTGDARTTGGVGLGLCLAREIVILHGGTINVESTFGEGSSFTILLPRFTEKEALRETTKKIAEDS
jgi:signal transduction histidine kinase